MLSLVFAKRVFWYCGKSTFIFVPFESFGPEVLVFA